MAAAVPATPPRFWRSACIRARANPSCVAENAFPATMSPSILSGTSARQGISTWIFAHSSPQMAQSAEVRPLMSRPSKWTETQSSCRLKVISSSRVTV
jgi:hypothetical protein